MISRITITFLLGAFIISGCAFKTHTREYRAEKVQLQYPDWDEDTVRKVAARKVEVGMNHDMVVAALGKPDKISRGGDEEIWGYSTTIHQGENVYIRFVYWVHLKNGQVSRTAGDRNKLTVPLFTD